MVSLSEARARTQNGEFTEAEEICRSLLASGSDYEHEIKPLLVAILYQMDKGEEAIELAKSAFEHTPTNAAWASDLGLAKFLTGDLDAALEILKAATALPDGDAAAYNRLAVVLLFKNDLEDAREAFSEAVLRDPDKAEIHSNLGGVMMRLERPDEALLHYRRALAIEPNLRNAMDGENAALIGLERIDEAIERMGREVEDNPDDLAAHLKLAYACAIDDRFQEAEDQFREAIVLEPELIDLRLELANLFNRQDRYFVAAKELKETLEIEPEHPGALNMLARTDVEMNRLDEAAESISRLEELTPDTPAMLISRAQLHSAKDDHQAAETDLLRALELHPGAADAHCSLGHTLLLIGRIDEAIEHFERAAEINPGALVALVNARVFPDDPEVIEKMQKFARNPLIPSEARSSMSFALTSVHEKRGDFDDAFEHANQANAQVDKVIDYSPQFTRRYIDAIIRNFTPRLFERCRDMGHSSERPVFVCGMPRSGTTLTEQVLCSHPDVFGAGELGIVPAITRMMPPVLKVKAPYPACMKKFYLRTAEHAAIYYLQKIAALDDTAARVVDKLPHNFEHLGLIALMFPNAKIIHLVRDRRDVAISNYFTNFKMKRGGMGFAFDLANIGHMINDHDRIMAHWREVLPVPIYDLAYEDLVDDQEETTRKLLDFVGLEWDARVMDFHKTERAVKTASVWQVRQPIYKTSKERWRRYEKHLGPLLDVLDK
ncbi:MAG: sulfotransferase [Rhodospirillales bacterium]|nr:sulfotransferase [Rhodospirillales bacterium]